MAIERPVGRPRWPAKLLAVVLVAGVVGLGATGCKEQSTSERTTGPQTNSAAPGLAQAWPLPATPLTDIATGQIVHLDTLQRPMLINFWASWCHPCLQEIPALTRLADDPALPVQVIGIAMDSGTPAAIHAFVQRHAMRYRQLGVGGTKLDSRYAIVGFPISYIVDAQGIVRRRLVGPQTETAFRRAIHAALSPAD